MGDAYGYQWRGFGKTLGNSGVDQLAEAVRLLKENPYSRRIITTFWNPLQSKDMTLLPCFYEHKFNVEKVEDGIDVLHLAVRSRSCDAPFGLPFNYTQYGIYLKAMANLVNMEAGTLCINIDDVHIYENQIAYTEEVVQRKIYKPPTLKLSKSLNSLEDMLTLQWEDITLQGLEVNKKEIKTPKPKMAI